MTRLLTSIKTGPVGRVPDARAHLRRKRRQRQTINQARKEESGEEGRVKEEETVEKVANLSGASSRTQETGWSDAPVSGGSVNQ